MTDKFGRKIEYLRLSLTERCQQKCSYCSKSEGGECVKDREMKTADFVTLARVCAELGFKKIRLTGGEPLLRRDLPEIIEGISKLNAYSDIALTTNAVLLSEQAEALKKAGLMRCNISLDSLVPETYERITGSKIEPVFEGIKAACRAGLLPLKINCVLIKGVNDSQIDDFIALAEKYPIDIRFIELMPMGDGGEGVSGEEILKPRGFLTPCEKTVCGEPAVYYTSGGFKGRVGFINPMSCGFCSECNRLRITSDGTVRSCLGANIEFSIKEAVDKGDTERIKSVICEAIAAKPRENSFGSNFEPSRRMNRIGG